MIERRRYMGLTALPYDYEVEYLESTGTQWIDTGFLHFNVQKFGIKYYNIGNGIPGYGNAMGCRTSSGRDELQVSNYNSGVVSVGVRNVACGNVANQINEVVYNGGNTVTVNGTTKTIKVGTLLRQNSVVLFGIREQGNVVQLQAGKIYYAWLEGNGYKVDLIPVRVGQVGYMYDKVSGQLFGNSGTGDFILGPEV